MGWNIPYLNPADVKGFRRPQKKKKRKKKTRAHFRTNGNNTPISERRREPKQFCGGLLGQPVEVEWFSLTNRSKPREKGLSTLNSRSCYRSPRHPRGWEKRERAQRDIINRRFTGERLCTTRVCGPQRLGLKLKMALGKTKEFDIYYSPSLLFNEIEKHLKLSLPLCWRERLTLFRITEKSVTNRTRSTERKFWILQHRRFTLWPSTYGFTWKWISQST